MIWLKNCLQHINVLKWFQVTGTLTTADTNKIQKWMKHTNTLKYRHHRHHHHYWRSVAHAYFKRGFFLQRSIRYDTIGGIWFVNMNTWAYAFNTCAPYIEMISNENCGKNLRRNKKKIHMIKWMTQFIVKIPSSISTPFPNVYEFKKKKRKLIFLFHLSVQQLLKIIYLLKAFLVKWLNSRFERVFIILSLWDGKSVHCLLINVLLYHSFIHSYEIRFFYFFFSTSKLCVGTMHS